MYANRDDMINRFAEREVNQLESMHIDGDLAMQNALSDATEQINSYLSKRYQTPVPKSEFIKVVACNIARFRLYVMDATDEVEARYKEAVDWLKNVSANKANVTFAEPLTTAETVALYARPVVPIADNNKGGVFGDAVFAQLPNINPVAPVIGGHW